MPHSMDRLVAIVLLVFFRYFEEYYNGEPRVAAHVMERSNWGYECWESERIVEFDRVVPEVYAGWSPLYACYSHNDPTRLLAICGIDRLSGRERCNCDYFDQSGRRCHHIWAMVIHMRLGSAAQYETENLTYAATMKEIRVDLGEPPAWYDEEGEETSLPSRESEVAAHFNEDEESLADWSWFSKAKELRMLPDNGTQTNAPPTQDRTASTDDTDPPDLSGDHSTKWEDISARGRPGNLKPFRKDKTGKAPQPKMQQPPKKDPRALLKEVLGSKSPTSSPSRPRTGAIGNTVVIEAGPPRTRGTVNPGTASWLIALTAVLAHTSNILSELASSLEAATPDQLEALPWLDRFVGRLIQLAERPEKDDTSLLQIEQLHQAVCDSSPAAVDRHEDPNDIFANLLRQLESAGLERVPWLFHHTIKNVYTCPNCRKTEEQSRECPHFIVSIGSSTT